MVQPPAMVDAILKRAQTVQGVVALVALVTLIAGLFLGSPVGQLVCGAGVIGLCTYLFLVLKRDGVFASQQGGNLQRGRRDVATSKEELYPQPEGDMKKLLFDDFQPPSHEGYVVKEIGEEESVVPSMKSMQRVVTAKEEKVREFEIADFFDLDSDVFRNEAEPRSEFNFLLNKLLIAMKDVLFAHSIAFFWANREKQQMVLEAKISDSSNFMTVKRYAIDQDVVSQVARTGKPQVLGRISSLAEKELVRHYLATEDIKSLIVVPVFYLVGERAAEQLPEGVIVADSKAEDAFGSETLSLMGQFTKMISALIKSYTKKYDLLLDSELLTSIRRLQDRIRSERTEQAVLNSVADEAVKLLNWDVLTVTMYSEELGGWALQKIVNRNNALYPLPNEPVDFDDSIVGKVIRTNTVAHISDLEAETGYRFSESESVAMKGSFLCVPISSLNRCYGALTLESEKKYQFSPSEVEVMYRLVENAASMLEVLYMNDLVKEHISTDQTSGSFTKKHFAKKLEEEVQRAEDFGTELALVSIAIDGMQEHVNRFGKEGFDLILNQVVKLIRINSHVYDVVGRQDANTLSVLLINMTANDAYLWAEKMRKHIASNILTLGNKSCSVTVSAGVCGLDSGMGKDELMAGTSQVLSKAIESGGNLVRVF
jgi:diguanylate cyclase (GGDEF)-like protein